MKRISIFLTLAAMALPGLGAAQDAKVITSAQATLGVPADGRMGPKTHAAVKKFQRAKGLEPSGELDPPTLTALGLGEPKPATARAEPGAKPTTPVGPEQSSAERTAEPVTRHEAPTGEKR
jgi:peptidoglycan hydrolase-like protein with peptidoglycan-binding domain